MVLDEYFLTVYYYGMTRNLFMGQLYMLQQNQLSIIVFLPIVFIHELYVAH